MKRTSLLAAGGIALLGLTGCPLTDDYFIGDAQGTGGARNATGGSAQGGGKPVPEAKGGAPAAGGAACVKRPERCNGYDDDCNGAVDEVGCNSAMGCAGFVLGLDPKHGYMFCSARKTWAQARDACAAQQMLLAAVESQAENQELARALAALTAESEVYIGANDQASEGDWVWDGGSAFWKGDATGMATAAFVAWASSSPDNYGNNEDCAILNPGAANWADRSCAGTRLFVCEDASQPSPSPPAP